MSSRERIRKQSQRAAVHGSSPGRRPHGEARDAAGHLEIVLKCDSSGCLEAVAGAIRQASFALPVAVTHAGIGAVNQTDVFLAATAGRLILGFGVGLAPRVEESLSGHTVEIRLYEVIHTLLDDLHEITASLVQREENEEKILGRATVIALFKGPRKGIILGCRVEEGSLAVGQRFRLIDPMGIVYDGRIASLQIDRHPVDRVKQGQEAGLKISDFGKARLGDLVETYHRQPSRTTAAWQPRPQVLVV